MEPAAGGGWDALRSGGSSSGQCGWILVAVAWLHCAAGGGHEAVSKRLPAKVGVLEAALEEWKPVIMVRGCPPPPVEGSRRGHVQETRPLQSPKRGLAQGAWVCPAEL